jgi:hypothetical protein
MDKTMFAEHLPALARKITAAMIGSILAAGLFAMALAGANSVQPRPAVDPTEAAEQRALEMRLERSGVLLAYEIVL